MSKTQDAVELVLSGQMNPHAAAEFVGIKPNSVYVALRRKRVRESGACPECGRPLPSQALSFDDWFSQSEYSSGSYKEIFRIAWEAALKNHPGVDKTY